MIRIYKNFSRTWLIDNAEYYVFNRTYNDVSTFEITLFYDSEIFEILTEETSLVSGIQTGVYTFLLKEDTDDAYILEDINVFMDGGVQKITLKGVGVENVLNDRVGTLSGNYSVTQAVSLLLNQNFISPADNLRKRADLIVGNLTVKNNVTKLYEYTNKTSVLDIILDITQNANVGFMVKFDYLKQKFVFELYEGKFDPYVIFDKGFNNIISEEWFFISRLYANTVYIGDTVIGTASGVLRKEKAVAVVKDESPSVTASNFLKDKKMLITADVQIDETSEQFIYLQDWNLGDIITIRSEELKTKTKKNIINIIETSESGVKKLDIVLGDYLLR